MAADLNTITSDCPRAVAEKFLTQGRVTNVQEYGSGNVNDTFLVTLESPGESRFILQRLNTLVFPQPELVMRNLSTCTDHMRQRLRRTPLPSSRRWETPQVLPTRDGHDYYLGADGAFWRALSFIVAARTFDTIQHTEHAQEVGYALGMFHHLLSDLSTDRLAVTLPGFHVTPFYLRSFDQVVAQNPPAPSPEMAYALQFVRQRRAGAAVLEEAKGQGKLRRRAIHGDPKVNNVMLDVVTGQAVGMIDLDTVQPGLIQYDLGDCLRSGCNLLGEETEQTDIVRFEPDLCRAILQGYLPVAQDFLTHTDYAYLFEAIHLITFELGLRFLTDYLAGDIYFKTREREHNLRRALVQFKLTESIESQKATILSIIKDLT